MKAVFCTKYGDSSVLQVKDTPIKEPNDDEVLIKNTASAITTADTMLRQGTPKFARLFIGLKGPKKPIMGTGFSGVIVKAGKNVKGFNEGDKVYGETLLDFGANAEYVTVCAKDTVMKHLPNNVSLTEAASICDGVLTSYNFLKDIAKVKPNEDVLIVGASGSLGTAGVQLAKKMGAKVTAVCSGANANLVKSLGADEVIDYTVEDFTKQVNQYDVVYDTLGLFKFDEVKKTLKKKGQYLTPVLNLNLICPIIRTSLFKGKKAKFQATGMNKVEKLNAFLDEINMLFNQNKLKVVLDKQYSINEVNLAHAYVDSGRKKGNVVMVFDE